MRNEEEVNLELEVALDAFAGGLSAADRSVLAPFLTTSGAAKATKDARFRLGLDILISRLKETGNFRSETLAITWRLTSVLSMREHRRRLVSVLEAGIPALEDLPVVMADPEDRRHFGESMIHVSGSWTAEFLAQAIVAERDAEKPREALARAFVIRVPTVADQITLLRPLLLTTQFEQQIPEVGRARRLSTILDALGQALWNSEHSTPPGVEFGQVFSDFILEALLRRPLFDRDVLALSASAVLRFVVMIVRLHGTLAADAKTYAFLGPLRRLLGEASWPREVQTLASRAAAQVLDQLIFLIRLNMPDTDLRRVYILLVGEVVAKLDFSKAANSDVGLDQEGGRWLQTGVARRTLLTQSAVEETAVSLIDREVAFALREAEVVETGTSALASDLLSAVDTLSPHLGEEARALLQRTSKLVSHTKALASRRHLVLTGQPGETVSFSPIEHEPSASAVGARVVVVVSRGVERVVEGKSLGIVLKADVERI